MEMLILLIVAIPIVLIIWIVSTLNDSKRRIDELTNRVKFLESRAFKPVAQKPDEFAASPVPQPEVEIPSIVREPVVNSVKAPAPTLASALLETRKPEPSPVTDAPPKISEPVHPPKPVPQFIPPFVKPEPAKPAINWEQFMGVKGFAWLGGFALFLGVVFFIKYSFDNNLVPPELRAAIGFITGVGLLVGGVMMSRRNFPALSQTLCATGVVVLYAITFACRGLYHFSFFGPIPTFLLMALITVVAFLLAVRMNALVVAILGMLGGFLTPVLISTGQDNPLGLFGYLAILDAGLILVALNRRWNFLVALAALGTAVMQIGWAGEFFVREKYAEGNKVFIALAVLAGFNALYLLANYLAKQHKQSNWWSAGSQLGLGVVTFGFVLYFFTFDSLALRPLLMFGFVLLIDAFNFGLAWLDEKASVTEAASGLIVFGVMAVWTANHLTGGLLNIALLFYFLFAVLHSALPFRLQRNQPKKSGVGKMLNHCFPPLTLLLVLLPVFQLQELSFLVWPFILIVDLLAIALAVFTATLVPVLAVLVLTLASTAVLIFKIPADLTGMSEMLWLVGAFGVFFMGISVWLVRKFKPDAFQHSMEDVRDRPMNESVVEMLPISAGVLPFALLMMAIVRLPIANPSSVFGLTLLLVVMVLALTRMFTLAWMPLVGLASTFCVEYVWYSNQFDLSNPTLIHSPLLLGWYLVFFAAFAVFPFIYLEKFANKSGAVIASALAGPLQFILVYNLVQAAWPNSVMGLVPAAFAIPAGLGLVLVLKKIPLDSPARLSQIAWFGGVTLFFITIIFPIQFNRQWITIGWALEGAALLWLFLRVPHPGLRLTGLGLLIAAFVRLALNPAVLEYHQRSDTPIFNWYLYTYGIVTVALFLGTRLLAPPCHRVLDTNVQALLGALGAILSFLLLNIEIADYFSAPGSTLTFQFSGNFARDMTYSIAWSLFALVLLVYGIMRKIAATRYAAMGLLCITLLKLFLHDLARLGQFYRIGALIGVAVVAMLASLAYQKFFNATAAATKANVENKP